MGKLDRDTLEEVFAMNNKRLNDMKDTNNKNYKDAIYDNPRLNGMRPKKLTIGEKAVKFIEEHRLALCVGASIGVVAIGVLGSHLGDKRPITGIDSESETTGYHDSVPAPETAPDSEKDDYVSKDNFVTEDRDVIRVDDCDLTNLTIVVRQATDNVADLTKQTVNNLRKYGVDVRQIDAEDNLIEEILDVQSQDSDRQIFVINMDGAVNQGASQIAILTQYDNDAKSADVLAVALQLAMGDSYETTINCGKKDVRTGGRTPTSVEAALAEAGLSDKVACLTFAPYVKGVGQAYLADDIADSVIRFASFNEVQRYFDLIRKVEDGDTIGSLAEQYGVSEDYIMKANGLSSSNINRNLSLIVKKIPEKLNSSYRIVPPTEVNDLGGNTK